MTLSADPSDRRREVAGTNRPRERPRGAHAEELRLSEERFRLLVESVQDYAIFMLDTTGRIISWNAGAQRIKGWTQDEIVGQFFGVFYPEEDLAAGKPQWELAVVKEEGRFEDEGWRVRKDGSRFWANVVITALHDDDGTLRGFAKVTRDLTERRATQQARERFIANAAHELRTPLSVLIGIISYLETHHDLQPREVANHLEVLSRQGRRMHVLVNNLLDLTLLEQGRATLATSPVDLAAAVDRVVTTLPVPHGKTVAIDVDGLVLSDPVRLEQVIVNLLANAYTYGGPNVGIASRDLGDRVELEVADDGPGLHADIVEHIFEPFRRGEGTGPGGSGLGLAIVRGVVEALGGRVRYVAGRPGARFIVDLPKG